MDLHDEDPDMEGWNDMYFDDDEPSDLEDADFADEDAFMDKINDVRDSDDEDDADDVSESPLSMIQTVGLLLMTK